MFVYNFQLEALDKTAGIYYIAGILYAKTHKILWSSTRQQITSTNNLIQVDHVNLKISLRLPYIYTEI